MWYEYPIPANFELQKRIIRQLREWIQGLEKRGLIAGYAFNHYSRGSRAPESPDEICNGNPSLRGNWKPMNLGVDVHFFFVS